MGGVLGEGGVADMMQGLDFPVVADESGELGRVACSEVRPERA